AAESQGFSADWGGGMVRSWVRQWIDTQELPCSNHGCHAKVYSPLDDPEVCTELHSYLCSNKWSMDPQKLSQFTKQKMISEEANKYLQNVVDEEMPQGLKQYMELELFPRIQLKGFRYTAHKKALYYDGHECPDVVQYQQDSFIPQMKGYECQLVKYKVGEVEVLLNPSPNILPIETKLVLCAHDEITAQANDGKKASWIWQGEQPLKKKGLGCGLHQSDFICSTIGWLKDASQTLEYGKNYDGYWNGELFVKQVSCIILLVCFLNADCPPVKGKILSSIQKGSWTWISGIGDG
ncbi:hypothetical protein M422DRAFT_176689, partial [Sphaerobolus stellatus SS14]